jgi:hypothetical protein
MQPKTHFFFDVTPFHWLKQHLRLCTRVVTTGARVD